MVNFGEEFQLSRWFNGSSSAHATDSEDGDAAGSADDTATPSGVSMTECFICHMPNPEFMSTNTAKKAPPVPVCSVGCEAKYLEMKGMRPSGDARDPNHCFICHAANPEFTTSNNKRATVVPVCSKECEEAYLRRKKQRLSSDDGAATSVKRVKGNKAEPARQRRTLNFLNDQLLDSSDGKGYKSWWLGALTFYDFVYQRHGMWHSYSISNDVPRVDPCLIKFGTFSAGAVIAARF
jgi:mono/diheme cytochrome c family protein